MTALRRHAPLLVLLAGALLTLLVYYPGLSGAWLVDDESNLGGFKQFATGAAPYHDLIFGNASGPLGRPVAMASFALNHVLGLFSTFELKASNLLIHLCNGVLLYLLLARLFRRRAPTDRVAPDLLAALIASWWLLLPVQISSVLYIVQRMAELSALFSLASCLSYVTGREMLQQGRKAGAVPVAASLLLFLPLAVLAKESGAICLAWLLLIEIFFFPAPTAAWRQPQRLLLLLTVLLLVAGTLLTVAPPHFLENGYLLRDFTLHERLLTQPRILLSYIGNIFLPDSSTMGIFQDDFPVSRSLLSPASTLLAIALLGALVVLALVTANSRRWWLVSFGIFFYLSGQLIESTFLPLELYFEHRNYLPAAGLLLAVVPVLAAWHWRSRILAVVLGLYLALLATATLQRTHIWGDNDLLLSVSAVNHPHSLRAWSDYTESLLAARRPNEALQAAQLAAQRNPRFAGISYLHMMTIICRVNQAPPPQLIADTASRLATLEPIYATPLSIGLEYLLSSKQEGHCGQADFTPLAPALQAQDALLARQLGDNRGALWLLRLNIAEWLIEIGHVPEARAILRDIWAHEKHEDMPTVGLDLAMTLNTPELAAEQEKVLDELEAVTTDAPADFRDEMKALRQKPKGAR